MRCLAEGRAGHCGIRQTPFVVAWFLMALAPIVWFSETPPIQGIRKGLIEAHDILIVQVPDVCTNLGFGTVVIHHESAWDQQSIARSARRGTRNSGALLNASKII